MRVLLGLDNKMLIPLVSVHSVLTLIFLIYMPPYVNGTPKQEQDKLIHLLELCKIPQDQINIEINKFRNSLCKTKQSNIEYQIFVGINPPKDSITMSELFERCKERIPYNEYIMCVEQNTEQGIRPHAHILAKGLKSTRPCREIQRLATIFKLSSQCIDYKGSKDIQLNEVRRQYIKGQKKDLKTKYVEQDRIDRDALGISHYYSHSNTQCLGNIIVDLYFPVSDDDDTSQSSRSSQHSTENSILLE